ncbi:alpha/beta hydrolase [Streptomyces sp. A2-16]|uniref:alpha/beta hydrolase n=1 Tax=Streptomyces sp. A2-16 TaxID=2781734 RepID=UPI001BAF7AD6|nr:alpha/beta hydrolase [Streptomyces sp. A2-16]
MRLLARSPRESPTRIANASSALIVSATGDTATTYRGSRAMHRLLTGSRLLTLDGVIAHGVYGVYGDACVDGTVNAYLASGRLPPGTRRAANEGVVNCRMGAGTSTAGSTGAIRRG